MYTLTTNKVKKFLKKKPSIEGLMNYLDELMVHEFKRKAEF